MRFARTVTLTSEPSVARDAELGMDRRPSSAVAQRQRDRMRQRHNLQSFAVPVNRARTHESRRVRRRKGMQTAAEGALCLTATQPLAASNKTCDAYA